MNDEARLLFHELADLTPDERKRVLSERPLDPEVRSEVQSLLNYDSTNDGHFTACIAGAADEVLRSAAGQEAGYCGPYRLVRLLGRGGMGSVYLGERTDGEIQQKVAVKLLNMEGDRPGWRDRFLKERQLLASLNHASIVHVIDAGHTQDGRPYLVMEYVDGVPIDIYCAQLSLRDRLMLFVRVCEGVSHAHKHLIIHRDLKPSNIFVDDSGQPKVMDFGIAKLLDENREKTQTIERLLTPSYASPEQFSGAIQTTATDIYSLGAVLHRLLAGDPPNEAGVPTDVAYILRKALRDEPEERYVSVEALGNDILAFLESRPVLARSGNNWYRTRKFLRRYWLPVTAALFAAISLTAGLGIANYERAVAQRRFLQVRRLAHTFVFDLHDEVAKLDGSTKIREMMVRTGLEYLDNLAKDAGGDLDLQSEIAAAYMKIGDAQGYPTKPNLGRIEAALTSYRKAGDIYRRVAASDTRYLPDLADYYLKFAGLVRFTDEPAEARKLAEAAIETFDRARAQNGFDAKLEDTYDGAWCALGDIDEDMDLTRKAYSEFSHCAELARAQVNKTKNRTALLAAAQATERIGTAARDLGLFAEALRALDEDQSALAQLLAASPHDPALHRRQALVFERRSEVYYDDRYPNLGDPARALENARRYLDATEEMVRRDPNNTSARFSQAVATFHVSSLVRVFDANAAADLARDSVRMFDGLLASGKPSFLNESRRLLALQQLGEAQLKLGSIVEARQSAESALAGQQSIRERNAKDMDARVKLVSMLVLTGQVYAASGDYQRSEHLLRRARDEAQQIAESRSITSLIALAHTEEALGMFYGRRHSIPEARTCYQRLAEVWRHFPESNEYTNRQYAAATRLLASLQ